MIKARHLLAAAAFALTLSAVPAQAGWWGGGKPTKPNPPSSSGGNASSSGGMQVPEPGNLGLFMAGVVGLAIGRRSSRIRRKRKTDGTA